MTLTQSFIPDPTVRTGIFFIGMLGCLVVIHKAWRQQWSAQLPWIWIVAAMDIWVAGMLLSYVEDNILGDPGSVGFPLWADAVWLCAYPLICIGVTRIVRARRSGLDRIGALDWLLVMVSVCSFGLLPLVEHVVTTHGPLLSNLALITLLAYPTLDIGLLALLVDCHLPRRGQSRAALARSGPWPADRHRRVLGLEWAAG